LGTNGDSCGRLDLRFNYTLL